MPSVLPRDVDQELAGRVGDPGLVTEAGRAGQEGQHLNHADPVQAPDRCGGDGQRVHGSLARESPAASRSTSRPGMP